MAYKVKTEGLNDVSKLLQAMGEGAIGVAARGLYDGAGVMAKEIETAAKGIKTNPFKWASRSRGQVRLPSPEEKEIVVSAGHAGIAKFRKSTDGVDTSVGYGTSGYAELKGKVVPIQKIANSINSGTSFMTKQPFFRKAVTKGRRTAVDAIVDSIEKDFEKMQSGGTS